MCIFHTPGCCSEISLRRSFTPGNITVNTLGISLGSSTFSTFLINNGQRDGSRQQQRSDGRKVHHYAQSSLTNGDLPRVTLVLSDRSSLSSGKSGVTTRRGAYLLSHLGRKEASIRLIFPNYPKGRAQGLVIPHCTATLPPCTHRGASCSMVVYPGWYTGSMVGRAVHTPGYTGRHIGRDPPPYPPWEIHHPTHHGDTPLYTPGYPAWYTLGIPSMVHTSGLPAWYTPQDTPRGIPRYNPPERHTQV